MKGKWGGERADLQTLRAVLPVTKRTVREPRGNQTKQSLSPLGKPNGKFAPDTGNALYNTIAYRPASDRPYHWLTATSYYVFAAFLLRVNFGYA